VEEEKVIKEEDGCADRVSLTYLLREGEKTKQKEKKPKQTPVDRGGRVKWSLSMHQRRRVKGWRRKERGSDAGGE